jgi:hypothetical protein
MLTISTSLARCVAGRRDQFLGIALEGMKMFERHGAAHTRLLAALNAGQASDVYALTNEFDSNASYGSFVDELYRDPEFESFLARITAADSPVTVVSRTLENELWLDRSGPTERGHRSDRRGAIVSCTIGRVHPGRMKDSCDLVRDIFAFLEDHGVTNCHLLELDAAGARTGELMARWECDSMHARGKVLDAWASGRTGRDLTARMRAGDAPFTVTWGGLYRDVHM